MPYRRTPLLLAALTAVGVSIAGCSSSLPSPSAVGAAAGQNQPAAEQNQETTDQETTDQATTGQSDTGVDPCQKLTTADVQPYVTVGLPAQGAPMAASAGDYLGCEWRQGLGTAVDVLVITGQDGQDKWDLAQQTGGGGEAISGIGDKAEHLPGNTDMWAIKGSGASAIWCGVTTIGWKELAGKKDLADVSNIPDATASSIAEQYGLLCNKVFGSGTTTPTMTVAAPTSTSPAGPGGTTAAAGGLMEGTDFPLPQGVDCSGSKVTKIGSDEIDCATTVPDPQAAYNYFLQALPQAGFTINTKRYLASDASGKPQGSIGFSHGKEFAGFDSLLLHGNELDVSLQRS
jgi:hypothetical protein